jgi:hypothetical protein
MLANNTQAYQPAFIEMSEEEFDVQIYRAGMQDWVMTIAQLWDAIGKPVDEQRLDLYCKQLRNVPLGLLEIGVNYAISNNTFSNVPPVGKIFEGIRKELVSLNPRPGMDMDEMIELWRDHKMKTTFYKFG